MSASELRRRIRFGEFVVDVHTQEIWRSGTKVKLIGQPLQILLALLEEPGTLIAREELQKRLWSQDVFVDSNHGLNAAVNKLREALNDSAQNPRYIETLPRRGYRFIGQVDNVVSECKGVAATPAIPEIGVIVAAPRRQSLALLAKGRNFYVPVLVGVGMMVLIAVGIRVRQDFPERRTETISTVTPLPMAPGQEAAPRFNEEQAKRELAAKMTQAKAILVSEHTSTRDREADSPSLRFTTVVSHEGGAAGPQFSPDGRQIAFMSNRSGPWQIWVSDADGGNARQVSTTESAGTPRWSPDGRSIVYDAPMHGGTYLVTQLVDGSEAPRPLVEGKVPSFSRDGRWVYYASERSGDAEVWKTRSSGGEEIQVTHGGGFAALESSDGFLYYSKSDGYQPELWRIPIAGGEEEQVSSRLRPRTWASWTVTKEGILFVEDLPGREPELSFYQPTRRELRDVVSLRSAPFWMGASFDGKRALVNDASEREITMVDNLPRLN
ncbi:MAG TPA: winged helix-turn-helix domain-containing protein [Candidatus Solibacter sp.]|nr:winged helix-turn-helix domain-containing protein [Candidatus Solibacter sp.]